MGLIQNLIAKAQEKKAKFEEVQEDDRIHNKIAIRKLSANERELNKFREEDRQERIKQMLNHYRKKKREEIWHGRKNNPLYAKNIIANQQNPFKNQKPLFSGKSDFTSPNIFMKGT